MDSTIGECIGEASTCWNNLLGAGEFNTSAALKVSEKLENYFNDFARCRGIVCETMQNDIGLRIAYQANIKMCLFDNSSLNIDECEMLANKLMDVLFDVKETKKQIEIKIK